MMNHRYNCGWEDLLSFTWCTMPFYNNTHSPDSLFFLSHVCLQGEVVEFIDEFLDEDYPVLESPPKH